MLDGEDAVGDKAIGHGPWPCRPGFSFSFPFFSLRPSGGVGASFSTPIPGPRGGDWFRAGEPRYCGIVFPQRPKGLNGSVVFRFPLYDGWLFFLQESNVQISHQPDLHWPPSQIQTPRVVYLGLYFFFGCIQVHNPPLGSWSQMKNYLWIFCSQLHYWSHRYS